MGYITPQGLVSLVPLPDEDQVNSPDGIAAGPDGNLWITWDGEVGRFNPRAYPNPGESLIVFPLPKPGSVNYATYAAEGITAGPDGNLWFTMLTEASVVPSAMIGRITPHGAIIVFPLPPTWHYIESIAKGPDGNLWFTGNNTDVTAKIGRITPQGVFTEFLLPNGGAEDIVAGPDGNLWFTNDGTIGRITPEGKMTEFRVPNADNLPGAITAGSDGNIWFTASDVTGETYKIGRIILGK